MAKRVMMIGHSASQWFVALLGLGCMAEVSTDTQFWLERPRPPWRRSWTIETCFQEGKQQLLGLGDYEGRNWQGWHRCIPVHAHTLLSAAGQAGAKRYSGLTLYPVAEALDAVLVLFRYLRRTGRVVQPTLPSRCSVNQLLQNREGAHCAPSLWLFTSSDYRWVHSIIVSGKRPCG